MVKQIATAELARVRVVSLAECFSLVVLLVSVVECLDCMQPGDYGAGKYTVITLARVI